MILAVTGGREVQCSPESLERLVDLYASTGAPVDA